MDVIAMYPSIPSSRAPAWVRKLCLKAGLAPQLVDWLVSPQVRAVTCTVAVLARCFHRLSRAFRLRRGLELILER